MNPILNTDSYKLSHFMQYPPGTTRVYSYIESRGLDLVHASFARPMLGAEMRPEDAVTVFFGLRYFLQSFLCQRLTLNNIDEAEHEAGMHGVPFNRRDFMRILQLHHGFWPVKLRAVPEGSVVPVSNVLVTVENTDPELPWVTSFLETALLRAVWYPTTVCTNSWLIKRDLRRWLSETAHSESGIDLMLHDFGARGVSSMESAAIGGAAHLVNFRGTDTLAGIDLLQTHYDAAGDVGVSIPASEHSTITSWGEANELQAYENMLNSYRGRVFACVSDSYDIGKAVSVLWGQKLRQRVIQHGARVVIRPDSGDPATTVRNTIMTLADSFGGSINEKGYLVLPEYIRVIQGDGIDRCSINEILDTLRINRLSAENVAFGMGGALLQKLDRDSLRFAMKCSAIERDGEWCDVYKTSPGKKSKRGRLKLVRDQGAYRTMREEEDPHLKNELRVMYENGVMTDDARDTIYDIRRRAARP